MTAGLVLTVAAAILVAFAFVRMRNGDEFRDAAGSTGEPDFSGRQQ